MSTVTLIDETPSLERRSITGGDLEILADIYESDSNIVVWQRKLDNPLTAAINEVLRVKPTLQVSLVLTPDNTFTSIHQALGKTATSIVLAEDIAELLNC